jgi:hypothetical protein
MSGSFDFDRERRRLPKATARRLPGRPHLRSSRTMRDRREVQDIKDLPEARRADRIASGAQ